MPGLTADALDCVSGRTAAKNRRHILPISRLQLLRVHGETEGIAGLHDDPVDERVVFVRIRPPVCCDSA